MARTRNKPAVETLPKPAAPAAALPDHKPAVETLPKPAAPAAALPDQVAVDPPGERRAQALTPDAVARVALAVLQAEGHAHAALQGANPLPAVRAMVERHLGDLGAPLEEGGEHLVRAVAHALRPHLSTRPQG